MVSQPRFPAVHMRAATGDAALVRILREGLGQALANDCIDLVLALALSRGCLERVPSDGERLRRFLVGPLTDAMEGFVGTVVAATTVEVLQEMLAPLLARESAPGPSQSGVHTRINEPVVHPFDEPDTTRFRGMETNQRSDEPTLRVPTAQGLVVVLVTQDPAAARRLQSRLDAGFTIVTATEIFSLMEALKNKGKQRSMLVFDCRLPPVAPSMMLNVASRIPDGTQVVLWGTPQQIEQQVGSLGRCANDWVRCDEQALAEDIGALIASALVRCA